MTLGVPVRRAPVSPAPTQQRRDIQALRAVAVVAVVIYHFWPSWLPGGFVGVDVFFVISGFLITGHLVRHPPRHAGDFARFWAKRVLRLLPAAFVVAVVTLVAVVLWMPAAQWGRMAHEMLAATFYFENWRLIADATDYLDAHRSLSPFQHFWSLSVEEQYYAGWPLIVGLLAWAGRSRPRLLIGAGLSVVVLVSFGYGVVLTSSQPQVAYFSTFGRIWELGVGSLLAVWYPQVRHLLRHVVTSAVLLWGGLVAIAVSVFAINAEMPFPGVVAVLPVLGAAAVLAAGDPDHASNPRFLSWAAPTQFVGNISYSLYLWHWPVVILAPYALGHRMTKVEAVLVLVLAVVLAWASTALVENPPRRSALLAGRTRRVLLFGLVLSVVVSMVAFGVLRHVDARVAASEARVQAALAGDDCVGAAALDSEKDCPAVQPLITSPEFAKGDITNGILGCLNWPPFKAEPISCALGARRAPQARIALFGNSHAGHWVEALDRIGKVRRWSLDTFVVGVCKSTTVPTAVDTTTGTTTEECAALQQRVIDTLVTGNYDAVVLSTMDRDPGSSPDLYRGVLRELARVTQVVVIRDTPAPMDQNNPPPDCVGSHLDDVARCGGARGKWIGADPLAEAALALDNEAIQVIDLNDLLCGPKRCEAVVGGVIAYSDFNHLSKSMSASLVPYLEPAIAGAVDR